MRRKSRFLFRLGFLAPAVLLYAVFVLLPLGQAFFFSLFRFRGLSNKMEYVGLENFQRLMNDSVLVKSVVNNLLLAGGCMVFVLVAAMLIAHAADMENATGRMLRAVYLFPHVISMVVVAILWKFIFHPTIGPLSQQNLEPFGFQNVPAWLGDSRTALLTVGIAFCWYALGFYIMVLSAGIRGIPEDVKEAAALDGSRGFFHFRAVTWPLLWSVRRIVVIHVIIATLNTFALVQLMTAGGPDYSSEVTLSYLYSKGIEQSIYGEATAIAVINVAMVMTLAGIVMLMFRRDPQEARR